MLGSAWRDYVATHGNDSQAWYTLGSLRSVLSPDEWSHLIEFIRALTPASPDMAFYRAIFLLRFTHERHWAPEARNALAAWRGCSSEHVLNFLYFIWSEACSRSRGASEFRLLFEQAGIPELLQDYGVALAMTEEIPAPSRVSPTPLRKVAVLSPYLTDFAHAGTQLALEHAALLNAEGLETVVFASQDALGLGVAPWLGIPWGLKLAQGNPNTWKPVSGSGSFSVRMAPAMMPHKSRWQMILKQLSAFSPDVVLFVGFFSPLLTWVSKYYPVLGISLHTQPPIGPIDVWLHQFSAGQVIPERWPGQSAYLLREYHFRIALPTVVPVSLAALNLPQDTLFLVSAGGRLSKEISTEWSSQIVMRLERYPQWCWLLIGEGEPIPHLRPSARIHILPYQEHLPGVLAQCALYLNPPRMGGGFSVLNAMGVGLAVISLADSDGGNKLGPFAANTEHDYWDQLDRLMTDHDARRRRGSELQARFKNFYDLRQAVPTLMAALREGQRHFIDRNL